MKKTILLFAIAQVVILSSCSQNEDVVKQPQKDGSIETTLSVKHGKGFDILTTTHKVWVKNNLWQTLYSNDTVPSLGVTTATSEEDDDGNTKTVTVPKDYEFYITVK
jgi:hypothetical protein